MNEDSLLRRRILSWYRSTRRSFPWRNTRDPYKILVSEVMLQQTQVSRVALKYPLFLKRFPSIAILARSTAASVLRTWRGMGYNNRAVRLRNLARVVMEQREGKISGNIGELRSLPGIGPYTSNAIACFAFGRQVPVVDTNVARVLSRLRPRLVRRLGFWETAGLLLPHRQAYDWNQALMDLGAGVCTARQPRCRECPVGFLCESAFKVKRKTPSLQRELRRSGIPNRIYRGRVIEALRNLDHSTRGLRRDVLAKAIKPDFHKRDRRWLQRLLAGLERDGLIRQHGNSISFAA